MLFDALSLFRRGKRQSAEPAPKPATEPAPDVEAASSTQERRRAPRRWGDPVQLLLWGGIAGTDPFRGWIVNRSPGGLGISSAQPVEVGTCFQVRVAIAPDCVPWVAVSVRGCYPLAGRWILSCEFVKVPSKEILLLFR
jgi:hypothetical protein